MRSRRRAGDPDHRTRRFGTNAQQEEEARKTSLFREAIISTAAEGICAFYVDDEYPNVRFSVWNERMTEITGYSLEEINRLGWLEVLHPDPTSRESARERALRMQSQLDLRGEEWVIVRKGGDVRTLSISTSTIYAQGTENGLSTIVALIQDITERKRALQALRESEQRFTQFMRHLPGLAWIKDLQGRYIYANEASEKVFGKPRAEFYGQTDDEVFPAATAAEFRENDRRAFETAIRVIETLADEQGTVHFSLVNKFPMPAEDGRPAFVAGIAVDVTDRIEAENSLRESEMRFRAIFDSEPECVTLVAPDGRLLQMNPAGLAMIEADDISEVVGQSLERLIAPEYAAAFQAAHACALRGDSARLRLEIIGLKGTRRWMDLHATPLCDAAGIAVAVLSVTRDISEQVFSADKLATQQMELLHVARLSTVGQMVAAMSHEVAQPLGAVSNFAWACCRMLESPAETDLPLLKQYLSGIVEESLRAGEILQRLRDFSRKSPARRARCELSRILLDSAELMKNEMRIRDVQLSCDLADQMSTIRADAIQLQQVIVNLLTNACDAMADVRPPNKRILLRSYLHGNQAVVEIADRGPGISAAIQERLFQPFVSTKPTGMGIGLSICRTIVEDHGGSIQEQAIPDGGTKFIIRLPIESPLNDC